MSFANELVLQERIDELRAEFVACKAALDAAGKRIETLEARVKALEEKPGHWGPM